MASLQIFERERERERRSSEEEEEEAMEAMGDEKVKEEALRIIGLFEVLPQLVIFDLDGTLWPFYCEFRSEDEMPQMHPHAKGILYAFKEKGVEMAIASGSPAANTAKTFIEKLGIQSLFVAQEIAPSWTFKTDHFTSIHTKTGVPFKSMLFFDDEDRHIEGASKKGVIGTLVGNGINLGALKRGLTNFTRSLEPTELVTSFQDLHVQPPGVLSG